MPRPPFPTARPFTLDGFYPGDYGTGTFYLSTTLADGHNYRYTYEGQPNDTHDVTLVASCQYRVWFPGTDLFRGEIFNWSARPLATNKELVG